MIIQSNDGSTYVRPANNTCGYRANSICFTHEDFRVLLLLGAEGLNHYFTNAILPRYPGHPTPFEHIESVRSIPHGFRAHFGEEYVDITAGEFPLPSRIVELEIGQNACEWLCQLDMRHGAGTLAEVIRHQILPRMVKLG